MSRKSSLSDWPLSDPRHLGEHDALVDPTDAAGVKRLEVNGEPVTEQSHEYVLDKKPVRNAED